MVVSCTLPLLAELIWKNVIKKDLFSQLFCKQPPLPYKYAAGCDESEDKSGSYLVWRPSAAQLERSKRGKNAAQENTKSREDDAFLKFLPKDRDLKTMIGIISIFYCYGLSWNKAKYLHTNTTLFIKKIKCVFFWSSNVKDCVDIIQSKKIRYS